MSEKPTDDWTLTLEQFAWMANHWNAIQDELENGDDEHDLAVLEQSAEYQALFPGMSLNEAIDRYESIGDPDDADLLRECIDVLRPFASIGAGALSTGDEDDTPVYLLGGWDRFDVDDVELTFGQFRRAAALLARLEAK